MIIPKLTDVIGPNKKVNFSRFANSGREGEVPTLWYVTEDGFEFPVPIEDTVGAEFQAQENSGMMMKWIRKRIKTLQEAQADFDSAI